LASSSAALQLTPITFFANTKITPLTVNATLITDSPTAPMVQIGPYQFNPQSVTLLYMTSSIGYAFIEVDPTIVDWNPKGGSPLQGITVHITKITYTEPGTTGAYADATKTANPPAVQSITWNAAENLANSVFFPVLNLPTDFQNLSFNWYAEYIYTSGVLYTSGTEDATTLSLPPVAKDAAPPAPKTDAPARRPVFLRALNVV
jgi:hypothetical protein